MREGDFCVLVKHLLVKRAVVELHRRFGHPRVHIVVLRGREKRTAVCKKCVEGAGGHQLTEGRRKRVVDGVARGGPIEQARKGGSIGFCKDLGQVRVEVAIDLLPREGHVGEVGRVRIGWVCERQRELCARDVIGAGQGGGSRDGELGPVRLELAVEGHGCVAALRIAREEERAGVVQVAAGVGRGVQGGEHVGAGCGFAFRVHVGMQVEVVHAEAHVVGHEDRVADAGQEVAELALVIQEAWNIVPFEYRPVHVDMDRQHAGRVEVLRFEHCAADRDEVAEEGHLVGHAVGANSRHRRVQGRGDPERVGQVNDLVQGALPDELIGLACSRQGGCNGPNRPQPPPHHR